MFYDYVHLQEGKKTDNVQILSNICLKEAKVLFNENVFLTIRKQH